MLLNAPIKYPIKKMLFIPWCNALLRGMLKPVYCFLPLSFIDRFPIVGTIRLTLPDNQKLYLKSRGNDHISKNVYWKGINGYEKETIRTFLKLLKNNDTFIDIGANIGLYALIAAIENRKRSVFAFEPVERVFDNLKTNVEVNQLTNLAIHRCAITNFVGEVKIYIPPDSIPLSASTLKGFRDVKKVHTSEALTLDHFVSVNNIAKVDLIKIDTEATENLVLEGATMLLKRDKPIIICEVLKGRTEKSIQSILENFQYQFFWIKDNEIIRMPNIEGDATYRHPNYIFAPNNKLSMIHL